MSKDNNDIEREELLYRYFLEELTSAEKSEVEAWCTLSSANQQQFDEVRLLFLDMKGLDYYRNSTIHLEHSWDKFRSKHEIPASQTKSSFGWVKYAASVVMAVTIAWVVFIMQDQVEPIEQLSGQENTEYTLSDQSEILLSANASLTYDEPFQNNERRVILKGDAFFNVSKNPKMPFVVEAGDIEIRVLGTQFFVEQSAESLTVNVTEGKVLLSYNDTHQIIPAGEIYTLDKASNTLTEMVDNTGITTFWKNRRLVFNLTSMEEVARTVGQAYDTEIVLEGETQGCSLTVTFENESLEKVLEIISSTLNYELIENQGSFILKGDGCE